MEQGTKIEFFCPCKRGIGDETVDSLRATTVVLEKGGQES
jgi:predicted subunit of tRNA(5-methylaminomethyl-2-thiouridylate) methyltransferase